jgi:hypothetical protein
MLKMDLIIETFKYFQNNFITKNKFKNCMKNVIFNDNNNVSNIPPSLSLSLHLSIYISIFKINKQNSKQYNNFKLLLNEEDDNNQDEDDEININDSDYEIEDNNKQLQQQQQQLTSKTQFVKICPKPVATTTTTNGSNSQLQKIFSSRHKDQDTSHYDENNEQSNDYFQSNNYQIQTQTTAATTSGGPYTSRHLNNPIPYEIPNLDEAIAANYHTLVTQDIAIKLKEILTNYEISREVFGEAILNASRKVTNYILTAPKTFQQQSKLYQERYIKVKMWLDDPLKIEKIKQWKSENNLKQLKNERQMYRNSLNNSQNHQNSFNLAASTQQASVLNNSYKLTPIASGVNNSKLNNEYDDNDYKNFSVNFIDNDYENDNNNNNDSGGDYSLPPNSQHYPYEDVKIDTNKISTEEIANQLKDVLTKYKISQRLFGQAILNAHKNVISLLLLEPKSWSLLSRQGRERYVQIYAWLNDKNRFKKISDFLATQNCKFQTLF